MTIDQTSRNRLIEEHLDYVRALAIQLKNEIGGSKLQLEELVAYGSRGLVEAAQRYDPSRGAAFSTFAYYRIRGAIFDGLRQTGWLGRSQWARFAAASNEYLGNLGERRAPAVATSQSGPALDELGQALGDLTTIFLTSMSSATRDDLPDAAQPDAATRLEREQLAVLLREALERLPGKERHLIELHYFEDLTLEEAGRQMGISKSWSSRLHARAIRLLAEALRARGAV
jgi:RNA polymerase sigma factor for flagellar operon FliA